MTNKIEITRELAEGIANYMEGSASGMVQFWHDQLRALLAAPAVERQEPVGEVADMKYNRVQFYRATGDTSKPYLLPGTKLYTSPPAPVVVVLPELLYSPQNGTTNRLIEAHIEGWNTAIDKVKELNQ